MTSFEKQAHFINANLKPQWSNSEIPFTELFKNESEAFCTQCNEITICEEKSVYNIPITNRFLIFRINNFIFDRNTQVLQSIVNVKLTEYDQDALLIPNINNLKYKIISAIMYNGNGRRGHYVVWKRVDGGWLLISDSYAQFFPHLIPNLKNVYLLFLETISENKIDTKSEFDINNLSRKNNNDISIIKEIFSTHEEDLKKSKDKFNINNGSKFTLEEERHLKFALKIFKYYSEKNRG
jgi:hypothetical protein